MITVDARQFTRAVALAGIAVERWHAIPALTHLRATVLDKLVLQGTDLDVSTSVAIPFDGAACDDFTLPEPARMARLLAAQAAHSVGLAPGADGAAHHVDISAGALAITASSLPAADHPGADPLREVWAATLGADHLRQLARVTPAISSEKTRYYLEGIHMRHLADWTWRFAATDCHRLHFVDLQLPDAPRHEQAGGGAIILPRQFITLALRHFRKADGPLHLVLARTVPANSGADVNLKLAKTGNRMALSGTVHNLPFSLASKLIDGTYPDYMRWVPTVIHGIARFQRAELVRAIRTVCTWHTEKTRAVQIEFHPGGATLSTHSPELGKTRIDIAAEHAVPKGAELGFNSQYLLDTLGALAGEEVDMHLGPSITNGGHYMDATIFRDPADTSFTAVLMPMLV